MTDLGVEQYMNAAEVAAATAVADLSALLPCDPEVDGQSECAAAFIAQFAPRVYRRPLTEEQLADANALYADARAEGTFDEAIRVTVQGLLQSPYFLYHLESVPTDEDGALQVLSGYEVASRLSYFFWESMPDEALFTAAAADALSTEAEIEAQARRMLADARASDTIRHFHTQWLGLEGLAFTGKDADLFPSFTPALADAMRLELERFAEYVILEDDARFETLMTSPKASLDAELAAVYGVDAPEGLDWVDLPADQRAGLLTRAAVMATHSHENQTSPVLRGAMVRTNILCQTPPPPPDTVDDTPPGLDPSLPTKERFAEHRDNPSCAGCHDLMDPLGYGLEHYDAIGAYRTMDGVNPVDATGEIAGTLDGPVDYDGPIEFSALLAAGEQARQCVSKQWFRYALGRFDAVADQCTIDKIYARFTASDFDIRELMVAIAVSDAMRNFKAATIDAD